MANESVDKRQNILLSFAQGRQQQRDDGYAVQEILTETLLTDFFP